LKIGAPVVAKRTLEPAPVLKPSTPPVVDVLYISDKKTNVYTEIIADQIKITKLF